VEVLELLAAGRKKDVKRVNNKK